MSRRAAVRPRRDGVRLAALALAALLSGPGASAAEVSFPTAASDAFLRAIAGRLGLRLTQGYGDHRARSGRDLFGYGPDGHDGWDVALGRPGRDGERGAPVHAPVAGRLTLGTQRDGKGRLVGLGRWATVRTSGGASVTVGHLGSFGAFASGQTVPFGAVLGFEGRSGNATGYHVHVEVRDADGRVRDPETLIVGLALAPAPRTGQGRAARAAPDAVAVEGARGRLRHARAAHEANRELYAVGGLSRAELRASEARARDAEVAVARALKGVPSTPTRPPLPSLREAQTAHDLNRRLYDVGGLSRVELDRSARRLESVRRSPHRP